MTSKHKAKIHIVVDEEVKVYLRSQAGGFETFNMVLRRLLGLPVVRAPLGRPPKKRQPKTK